MHPDLKFNYVSSLLRLNYLHTSRGVFNRADQGHEYPIRLCLPLAVTERVLFQARTSVGNNVGFVFAIVSCLPLSPGLTAAERGGELRFQQ